MMNDNYGLMVMKHIIDTSLVIEECDKLDHAQMVDCSGDVGELVEICKELFSVGYEQEDSFIHNALDNIISKHLKIVEMYNLDSSSTVKYSSDDQYFIDVVNNFRKS